MWLNLKIKITAKSPYEVNLSLNMPFQSYYKVHTVMQTSSQGRLYLGNTHS